MLPWTRPYVPISASGEGSADSIHNEQSRIQMRWFRVRHIRVFGEWARFRASHWCRQAHMKLLAADTGMLLREESTVISRSYPSLSSQ